MKSMTKIFTVALVAAVVTGTGIALLSPASAPDIPSLPASGSALALATDTEAAPAVLISAPIAPKLALEKPLFVGTTTAMLAGTVSPHGSQTSYWFEYSADPALGLVLAKTTPRVALSTTTGVVPVGMLAVGLTPSTTYYFRLVVESPEGTVRSATSSLLTK